MAFVEDVILRGKVAVLQPTSSNTKIKIGFQVAVFVVSLVELDKYH